MAQREKEEKELEDFITIKEKVKKEPEDFIRNMEDVKALSEIRLREKVVKFLLWAYGGTLIATFSLIFLHYYFNARGFKTEATFLQWLGGATVGEIGGLLSLVWGYLFRTGKQ